MFRRIWPGSSSLEPGSVPLTGQSGLQPAMIEQQPRPPARSCAAARSASAAGWSRMRPAGPPPRPAPGDQPGDMAARRLAVIADVQHLADGSQREPSGPRIPDEPQPLEDARVHWQAACTGPAVIDVAHCRVSLVTIGTDATERFTALWRQASGAAYHPWADVVTIIGFLDDLRGDWGSERLYRKSVV